MAAVIAPGTTLIAAVRALPLDLRATVVTHSPTVAGTEKIGAASGFAVLPLAGVAGMVADTGGENAAVSSFGAPLIQADGPAAGRARFCMFARSRDQRPFGPAAADR
ncbi:hypothetical protein [Nonomuraea bangladeshensis]|uniref:hypothetical protein n=1 Tax=Nonomuraea bangladeshensis TaxID=404385 RepID=UPI0031DF6CDC